MEGQKERKRFSNPKKEIDGIFFDTDNPKTLLIAEVVADRAGWDPRKMEVMTEQIWRTKDGNYFTYSGIGDPERINMEIAHAIMDSREDYRRLFLTPDQMQVIKQDDENRQTKRL